MTKYNLLHETLSIVDPTYPKNENLSTHIGKDRKLLGLLLRYAKKNGLLYAVLDRLKELGIDVSFAEKDINNRKTNLKKTLIFLNNILEEYSIPYILIKACNEIPHIPRDVDIFVRSEDKKDLIKAFEDQGAKIAQTGSIETTVEFLLPIDIYTKIIYFGREVIDSEFLFKSTEKKETMGIEYVGLNDNAEFMLNSLHSLFGHGCLTLLDFLHLKVIRSKLDTSFCRSYASTRGWGRVFDLLIEELDSLYDTIYTQRKAVNFPYLFGKKFILDCISQIDGINLSFSNKLFIISSLLIDEAKLKVETSALYDIIKLRPFKPIRKTLLSIAYLSRSKRGDRYS